MDDCHPVAVVTTRPDVADGRQGHDQRGDLRDSQDQHDQRGPEGGDVQLGGVEDRDDQDRRQVVQDGYGGQKDLQVGVSQRRKGSK